MSQHQNNYMGGFGMNNQGYQQQQDFPSMDQQFAGQNQQQQNNQPAMQMQAGSNPFQVDSLKVKAFVPEGMVGYTDDYPGLGDTFGQVMGKPKGKKKGPSKEELEAKKKAEMEALPTKGKEAEFFIVPQQQGQSPQPSQEQMMFVYQFYPQYSYNPGDILTWCYNEALRLAEVERRSQQLTNNAYDQRPSGTRPRQQQQRTDNQQYNAEDYNYENLNEDSNFGQPAKKQTQQKQQTKGGQAAGKGKNQNKNQQKTDERGPVQEKKAKVVQDQEIKVNEAEITQVDMGREPCSLVFIGHVDAGKSTISGQIMLQMDMIDEREIEKYRKEAKEKGRDSWWLAYVMDVGDEEKAKGKTVEMGRAHFNTANKQVTVFDAPGHKNYVPNMIMGASMADFGGLVISARKGEYEAGFEKDGQTREHVQLARSLGVQKIIVVVNKMDDNSVNWNESRWLDIQNNLTPFLIDSGYKKSDFVFVPISGLTGENLKEPVGKKVAPWYNGPTLIEAINNLPVEKRNKDGAIRIPVLDKMKDNGMVAFGKVEQGSISIGDKLMIQPSGNPTQVSQILDHKNESVKYARPGENIQIRLTNIEDHQLNKGDVIVTRDAPVPVTMLFEAEMELLELIDYKPIMSKGYQCILHLHTISMDCLVKDILEASEKIGTEWKQRSKPSFVRSFAKVKCRIQSTFPVACEKYEVLPQLGRFTLRDEGRTIACGRIIKYKPHNVAPTIVVGGGNKSKLAQESKNDKNDALVFDMETGKATAAKPKLDAIHEEGEDFP